MSKDREQGEKSVCSGLMNCFGCISWVDGSGYEAPKGIHRGWAKPGHLRFCSIYTWQSSE